MLRPDRVRPGDVLIGMGSSGLHSNGYSLARHVLLRIARMPLEGHVEEFGHTLGEELLVPTTIYARDCLALVAETNVHTFAHITGGGLARNLARVLPDGARRGRRARQLDPAAGVPADRRRWAGSSARRWSRRSTWASGWSPCCPPTTSTARWPCSPPGTCPRGCWARCGRGSGVELKGDHPRF